MSEEKRISIGDTVTIYFERANALFHVVIHYMPNDVGDCFVVEDKEGNIYNVQNYAYMVKESKKNNDQF